MAIHGLMTIIIASAFTTRNKKTVIVFDESIQKANVKKNTVMQLNA